MTDRRDDDNVRGSEEPILRDAFAALRQDDAANAPAFEAVLAAAEARSKHAADRRRPWLVPSMVGSLAAAALVVAVLTVVRRPEPRLPSMASIEQWTAPTDFLLDTPGREFLESVPRFGSPPTTASLDAMAESGRRPKRRSESP
jgi:hypothetical protein